MCAAKQGSWIRFMEVARRGGACILLRERIWGLVRNANRDETVGVEFQGKGGAYLLEPYEA